MPATRAAVRVASGRLVERQAELIRDRREPRQHIGQLDELLLARALAHRLRELADLLGQPCHRRCSTSRPVPLAVRVAHECLEPVEVHNRPIFANREDAGRQLATLLDDLRGRADVLVLGLPRGGVPVAHAVAHAIGAPLDVFVVRKLGAPQQPELALGAIASGGAMVLNDDIVQHLGIDAQHLQPIIDAQRQELDERERSYRGDRGPLDIRGRTVALVDDGLATGATMRAAVAAVQSAASAVIVAVPVGAPEAVAMLRNDVDRVEAVSTPSGFAAVGLWYRDFHQVSEEEVRRLLA